MVNDDLAYLGTGWCFPPSFHKTSGQVGLASSNNDIQESLQILLQTNLGERVMQPTYGCNLSQFIFEPLSPTVASQMKEAIRTAILYNEPRIQLDNVDLQLDPQLEGIVNICIDYTVLGTNSRFSFVYPFYQQEGVGLP